MPRALVTGGAGFIGSHVTDRLIAAGYDIVVIDDLSSGYRENLAAGIDLRVADVKSPEVAEIISSGRFDVIAHLAAQVDVRKSVADPISDLHTNIGGTVNLLEAVRALPEGFRPRLIFASTGGALYGEARHFPTAETAPTNPDAPYGVAKLAAEYYLAYASRIWNIETAVVRFGNVYGPRQDAHGEAGVIAIFAQRLFDDRPLTIYGSGRQTRDYVYVSDVANAFLAVATHPLPPAGPIEARAFNIGTAVETSVVDLARELAAISGKTPTINYALPRAGEVDRSVLDPGKAWHLLGWRAEVSLSKGLAATYAWLTDAQTGAR